MPKARTESFIGHLRRARAEAPKPSFAPLNPAALWADHGDAQAALQRLTRFQRYIGEARAEKARRKGVPLSFERAVRDQARTALADLDSFCGASLRVFGQVNQGDVWGPAMARMRAGIRTAGPLKAREHWAEFRANDEYRAELEKYGLTDEVMEAVTTALADVDAELDTDGDAMALSLRLPGEARPRRITLSAPTGTPWPRTAADLWKRAPFEHVAAAFGRGEADGLELVETDGPPDYRLPDVFALGAVAARRRMAEDLRQLEDGGLPTVQGHFLDLIIGLIALGIFIGVVGASITYVCENHSPGAMPPDWLCEAGIYMMFLAIFVIFGALTVAVVTGTAIGVGAFIVVAVSAAVFYTILAIETWGFEVGTYEPP